ncbi:hypothetical protein BPAE_0061g00330 [Botrytis paeoniae]|uniref:Heterokaryon incompatibility domain-containing protein n=1 Tax=Botrytis paeoniae TaxID=278948 RepID=A0A4Z1FXD2_9HELO|nr:hypothetical protein BPAE_0061g00330 [Botrytis paeoniae]
MPIRLYGIRRSLASNFSQSATGDIEAIGVLNGCDRDMSNLFSQKLALVTLPGNPAAVSLLRKPFIRDFASEECSNLIKSWLSICVLRHSKCTISSPVISPLPTRVIRVGYQDGPEPVLYKPPSGSKSAYIALSYCWGRRKNILLTKEMSELPNSSAKFPMSLLLQTLRGAVQIARNLGFEYIWIDSLCIIQEGDDTEDLRREHIKMHELYGNATLTIAAAADRMNPEDQSDCVIGYDLEAGSSGTANVVFESNKQGNERINEPLNTRGWTFQECVLSPRTIVFYKDQIGWDCASIIINSNGPLNPLVNHHKDSPGRISDYLVSHETTRTRVVSENEACMEYWRKSVEFYSLRNISYNGDKLRAISGCAQWIKSKTSDGYLAGLWASDLRTQIFWYTEGPSSRQVLYRAPSWSWASVDWKIKFWLPDQIINTDPVNDRVGSKKFPRISLEPKNVRMIYSTPSNECGDILKGSLSIEGVLKPWRLGEGKFVATKKSMSDTRIFFDEDIDEILFWLHARDLKYFLFFPSPESSSRYFALILKRVDVTFRRVGMAGCSVEAYKLYTELDINVPQLVVIE